MSLSSSQSSSSEAQVYTRGILLRRLSQQHYLESGVDGFRFQVQAYGAYLMPSEIFRYLQRFENPLRADLTADFDGVCSSVDLEEYPSGAPVDGQSPPYFRTADVDLVFRSRAEADKAWAIINEEVAVLVNSLNLQDTLTVEDIAIFGGPPPANAPS